MRQRQAGRQAGRGGGRGGGRRRREFEGEKVV